MGLLTEADLRNYNRDYQVNVRRAAGAPLRQVGDSSNADISSTPRRELTAPHWTVDTSQAYSRPGDRPEVRDQEGKLMGYDTGIRIKIGEIEKPLLIAENIALEYKGKAIPHTQVDLTELSKHLDSLFQLKNHNLFIHEGLEGVYRHDSSGLNHLREVHTSEITDISWLKTKDGNDVSPASQFPNLLNNDQLQFLIEQSLNNIGSITIAGNGSVNITGKVDSPLLNTGEGTPSIRELRLTYNPNNGILTVAPKQSFLTTKLALAENGSAILKESGKIIEPSREQLQSGADLVIVNVDKNNRPSQYIRKDLRGNNDRTTW
jgi:hypothetical protein